MLATLVVAMPHGLERRSFADPVEAAESVGVRPLQLVCVIGVFGAALISVLAFDEVSLKGIVISLAFSVILVVDTIWRGLRSGKLAYRGSLIDGASSPIAYFGILLFYLVMTGFMIYFGVDMWLLGGA